MLTVAFETMFGWVLAGSTSNACVSFHLSVASFHVAFASGDKLLHKFWEVEESPRNCSNLSLLKNVLSYISMIIILVPTPGVSLCRCPRILKQNLSASLDPKLLGGFYL